MKDETQSCYLARLKIDGSPAGIFSVKSISPYETELSYILRPEAQGKGFAAEAVVGLEDLCRENTDAAVLTAQIHADNARSIKLIIGLGYCQKERKGNFITYQKLIDRKIV